eukprot:969236-Amphidinium_carterae.1
MLRITTVTPRIIRPDRTSSSTGATSVGSWLSTAGTRGAGRRPCSFTQASVSSSSTVPDASKRHIDSATSALFEVAKSLGAETGFQASEVWALRSHISQEAKQECQLRVCVAKLVSY